ncbi:MAG: hypothetical protein AAB074_13450 [Planctomycetota bacterium]
MRRFAIAALALAALAGTGCASHETITVHSEPVVCAETELLLVLQTSELEDGRVALQAWRERDRVVEQDFWKTRAGRAPRTTVLNVAIVAEGAPFGVPARDNSIESHPEVADAFGEMMGLALAEVLGDVVAAMKRALWSIGLVFRGRTPVEPWPPQDLVTLRRRETIRTASARLILARADGSGAVSLGVQPASGYVLDAALVEQLGGRGARILACDHELSATVVLQAPR